MNNYEDCCQSYRIENHGPIVTHEWSHVLSGLSADDDRKI